MTKLMEQDGRANGEGICARGSKKEQEKSCRGKGMDGKPQESSFLALRSAAAEFLHTAASGGKRIMPQKPKSLSPA